MNVPHLKPLVSFLLPRQNIYKRKSIARFERSEAHSFTRHRYDISAKYSIVILYFDTRIENKGGIKIFKHVIAWHACNVNNKAEDYSLLQLLNTWVHCCSLSKPAQLS